MEIDETLKEYLTLEGKRQFWKTNTECYKPFSVNKPRVPFTIGSDGGLVLSIVGCLNEGTPVDNILAAMWAVEQYGGYNNNNLIKDKTNYGKPRELKKGMPMILEVE